MKTYILKDKGKLILNRKRNPNYLGRIKNEK